MTIGMRPICLMCRRLNTPSGGGNSPETCEAFPNGIPDEIFYDGFNHTKPYPSDGGVRFEATPGREADAAKWIEIVSIPSPQ